MANDFTDAFAAASQARLGQQRLELERQQQALRDAATQRELAIRESEEKRAQEAADYANFMGPIQGVEKSPYGGVAATDLMGLRDVYQQRKRGVEPSDLQPGDQGPPAANTEAGLTARKQVYSQGVEDKLRSLFDMRYLGAPQVRADAQRDVAERNANAKIEAARIAAQGRQNAANSGASGKESAGLDKEWRGAMDKYSPYLNRGNTALGLSGTLIARMKEAQTLPESVDMKLTPQENTEFWTAIARNVSGGGNGGQVALGLIHELAPQTLYMDTAQAIQYAKGMPQDARVQEFTKRGLKILARQEAVARQNIKDGIRSAVLNHRKAFIAGGPEARAAVAQYGFNEDELNDLFAMPVTGGGQNAQVKMRDPSGAAFWVDPAEVAEAKQNGWTQDITPVAR